MRCLLTFATLAAILPIVYAGPVELKTVQKVAGEKKAGSYIVTLKEGASSGALLKKLQGVASNVYDKTFVNGFSAQLNDADLLIVRSSSDVESIEEDGIFHTAATVTQPNAPWGLCRLSQDLLPLSTPCTYKYDSVAGANVGVYIISTGISITNAEFGGRAVWGATFGGYPNQDASGQGTYCAGLVGSNTYGVAKRARLIGVKFLSDSGSGTASDLISSINWSISHAASNGLACVIVIDAGGSTSSAVNSAVSNAASRGCHVVVPAGNSNTNVLTGPAQVASAITVGATDSTDKRTAFSNFGPGLDIFAPGQGIISVGLSGTLTLSGTSPSACYVAGLVAYLISRFGNWSPGTPGALIQYAVPNIVQNLPAGTPNYLANNEF